mmetsp:Transcript_19964/g.43212  ORF Transcript_19964/g.43212 Transcript_19964/m.43212 type:complete len:92 (-) Transcript_19964:46-321(-)
MPSWTQDDVADALIPAGCATTGVILVTGLFQFMRGNSRNSQKAMRARVVAQGVTVACMMSALALGVGRNRSERPLPPNVLAHREKENANPE